MDFRHLIVTCLFSMLRLSFETQKIKENYAIFIFKHVRLFTKTRTCFSDDKRIHVFKNKCIFANKSFIS